MKILSSFLIIFVFIFTLTLNSPPSSAVNDDNNCNKFLCDEFWRHVKSDKPYRIGPPFNNEEEGTLDVKLESTVDGHPCPRNGIVLGQDGVVGDYFIFTPVFPTDDGRLPLETPFSISAVKKSGSCNESGRYLRITRKNEQLAFWHVTGDGEFNKSTSCFRFINYPDEAGDGKSSPSYMLRNCPGQCRGSTGKCFSVGNGTEGGYNYLTISRFGYELELRGRTIPVILMLLSEEDPQ